MCFGAFIGTLSAQEFTEDRPMRNDSMPGRERHMLQTPNPEKAAKAETDRLQKALQLTDKQYKKIYKLNLQAEKERLENRMQMMPDRGDGPSPMQPLGDARPPMPPAGDFGQQGDDRRPPMPADRGDRDETLKKNAEKREKKMKKILTDEQYEKWKQIQTSKQQPRPDAPVPPDNRKEEEA